MVATVDETGTRAIMRHPRSLPSVPHRRDLRVLIVICFPGRKLFRHTRDSLPRVDPPARDYRARLA